MPHPLLSLADAARRVGVSRRTLQRALQAGTLRKQPAGRIALADLLALGYELGPGGRNSVLAVRLLEELTAAHARERDMLQQQVAALAQELAACRQALEASQHQVAALQLQRAPERAQEPRAGAEPATEPVAPVAEPVAAAAVPEAALRLNPQGRVALAGLLGALMLLL